MNYDQIISQKIQNIKPSGIRNFFDILEEMKDAISLGVGEPDFVTPWHIRDAGIYSLERGHTKYTSNAGMLELRREIANYLRRRFDLEYDYTNQILVTVGGSEAIDLAIRVLVNPGDEVIIPVPSFVCYGPLTEMAGGVPVYVELTAENGFRLTPEQLKAAITPRTKALVLPFPSNPTGGIMEKADLEKIAQVVRETGILVISDEIYGELTYGDRTHISFASLPDMWQYTITLNGFSKAFAMTGWRVGYACGPKEILSVMLKIHQYSILCAPRMGQVAALEALQAGRANDYEDVRRMRDSYDRRRRLMVDSFRKMGLDCFEPLGAFYVFPSIKKTGLDSETFCERLLNEYKIATVPGTAFGECGEGHIRCSYATGVEKLNIALERMSEFVDKCGK